MLILVMDLSDHHEHVPVGVRVFLQLVIADTNIRVVMSFFFDVVYNLDCSQTAHNLIK